HPGLRRRPERMSEGYDVIIVGSGLVGSAYARILAERAPQLRMLMLEAGPRLTNVPGVNVRNETAPAERARLQPVSEAPDVTTEGFEPTAGARAALAGLGAAFDAGRPPGRQVQPMPLACTPRPGASPRWSGADTVLGLLASGAHDGFELRPSTLVRRILHAG